MLPSHVLIYFNIIIPSTPGSYKWSPSFRSPPQNPVCTSPLAHTCCVSVHLILLNLITYTFVNSKDWVKLQLTFFSSSILSSVCYVSVRFVVLTAVFQRIQVVCVDAVSLCTWFPTFRTWILRAFETLGTTHQTAQRIIQKI
jgi:hypothetical protein